MSDKKNTNTTISFQEVQFLKESNEKMHLFYDVLVSWINLLQNGEKIEAILRKRGYHSIAIYGMAELGQLLLNELLKTNIEVKCLIDQKADMLEFNTKIVKPTEFDECVDAIIVTAVYNFSEIEKQMTSISECVCISLEELVCQME